MKERTNVKEFAFSEPIARPKRLRRVRALVIRDGKKVFRYAVTPITPCGFGKGFFVYKLDGGKIEEIYQTNVDGNESVCSCIGFLQWGRCKHVDAMTFFCAKGEK